MSVDIHALSGAYAVDAVDDLERMHFERHLADCAACRAEVDSLREAAAQLAESTLLDAPPILRQRVLAEIATVRPLAPLVAATPMTRRTLRRRLPALAAAAAVLVALGGAGATVWHPWADEQVVSASPATRVLDAADARSYDGDHMVVTRSASLDQAVVTATDLEPLPTGQVYQLWMIRGSEFTPAGLLHDPRRPTLLHGDAATVERVGITIERAGGAERPDLGTIVGSVDLRA